MIGNYPFTNTHISDSFMSQYHNRIYTLIRLFLRIISQVCHMSSRKPENLYVIADRNISADRSRTFDYWDENFVKDSFCLSTIFSKMKVI